MLKNLMKKILDKRRPELVWLLLPKFQFRAKCPMCAGPQGCWINTPHPNLTSHKTFTRCFVRQSLKGRGENGFTLAEVLITLGIIGVVAAMTIPSLIQDTQNKEMVTGLLKFNTNLQQAIDLWKEDIGCHDSVGKCLYAENLADGDSTNFDQIAKFMKIADKSTNNYTNDKNWLPDNTLDYYGEVESSQYGQVAHSGAGNSVFLMQDGTTFSIDIDPAGFDITVDVNGKKPPNRIGKDTFKIRIGDYNMSSPYCSPKDICYDKSCGRGYTITNGNGLCGKGSPCQDANNTDPTIDGGAAVTSYVILNHKLPDFKKLSQSVAGFKP